MSGLPAPAADRLIASATAADRLVSAGHDEVRIALPRGARFFVVGGCRMSDEQLDAAGSLHLPPEPASAARARRFIVDLCKATQMPAELCDTAALLVSELVTNAVIHGKTSATIEVHRPPDTLRVSVRDDNPVLPAVGDHPKLTAESGRGMRIVSVLADAWGVEKLGSGKAIWFELRLR